ncbi:MAG: hypothetical protein K8I29_03615 [Alphaproteobacteria bacterium]|uniref:Universal stress protein n=1 Tax=Candidatus Nitrobium versatile TaxID=2884831 RepID=A0A953JCJ3_9BACT|nr:hypothetical protein [Candidatus Nitrobium versatile]
MRKKQLLFVTYHNEKFGEGFSYAIDLAKAMNEGISVLMIYKRKVMEKIGDMMTVVAFAEADEHKTAREMIAEDYRSNQESYDARVSSLKQKCQSAGIPIDFNAAAADIVSAIKNILRQNTSIDMVLLSPSITGDGAVKARELNRLVRTASRPVVTMAKGVYAA